MILKKKKKPNFIEVVTRKSSVLPVSDKKQGLDFLVSFFSAIRPVGGKKKSNQPAALHSFSIGQYGSILRTYRKRYPAGKRILAGVFWPT